MPVPLAEVNLLNSDEIFVNFSRRSMCEVPVSTWLMQEPVTVRAKRRVRNKIIYDLLVNEVDLVQVNQSHGIIRHSNGHESNALSEI